MKKLAHRISAFVLGLAMMFSLSGCGAIASEDVAIRTLEASGFSNIQITDHAWFKVGWRGCSDSDKARFTATATNPAGQRVEVYVCTGAFLKGGTIRVK